MYPFLTVFRLPVSYSAAGSLTAFLFYSCSFWASGSRCFLYVRIRTGPRLFLMRLASAGRFRADVCSRFHSYLRPSLHLELSSEPDCILSTASRASVRLDFAIVCRLFCDAVLYSPLLRLAAANGPRGLNRSPMPSVRFYRSFFTLVQSLEAETLFPQRSAGFNLPVRLSLAEMLAMGSVLRTTRRGRKNASSPHASAGHTLTRG